MGNTYRNIFVQSVADERVAGAVEAAGVSAYVFKGADWSVVIPKIKFDGEFWVRQQTLARDCSAAARCCVLSFAVHDSSMLLAELWRDGQWCGGYASAEEVDEPAFRGLTAELLATTFGVADRAACARALERKPGSKRGRGRTRKDDRLTTALDALARKYEGHWDSPAFQKEFQRLAANAINQAAEARVDEPPFASADEQHLAICEVLRLPADPVGVDFADVANGEANLVATLVKPKRTRRAKRPD
jgi:hypothetical protein